MFDFIKFVKEHPGIDLKLEYWHDSPRGLVITMTKYPPMRRFRFCIQDELYFDNVPHKIDTDSYIETWLNDGLEELNKEGNNDQN